MTTVFVALDDTPEAHCLQFEQGSHRRYETVDDRITTTFQSRFGPEEWLKPYTVEEVARLASFYGNSPEGVFAPCCSAGVGRACPGQGRRGGSERGVALPYRRRTIRVGDAGAPYEHHNSFGRMF